MADNVPITAGSGTDIATDDVSGSHYQKMKLYTSEADSAEGIGDDDKGSQRSLWVSNRPRSATQEQASAGLTTSTTGYSIGDTLGTGWTFTNMASVSGGLGRITGIRIYDKADIMSSITLFLAAASVTFGTDNTAPNINDTDVAKINGIVTLGFVDLGGARVAALDGLNIPYLCDATSLFVYAITNVAHTFFGAVGDVPLRLFYELD